MAIGSGLSGQVGFKEEGTFGTYAAPDNFVEFTSEGLVVEQGVVSSEGIGRGAFMRSDRDVVWQRGAAGPVTLDVLTKGMLLLLKHAFGSVVSAQVEATDEYTHTFTSNPDALDALSLTLQVGKPSTNGTVNPHTYLGAVITSATIELSEDGMLTLTVEFAAKEEVLNQSLASASYPAGAAVWAFPHATLEIDSTPVVVKSFSYTITNALDLERRGIGAVKRRQPIANGSFTGEGSLDAEFENLDLYNDFLDGSYHELVLSLEQGEIAETGNPYAFHLTIPAIRYTGETPTVGGKEVLRQPLPFVARSNGTDPIHTLVIHSDETAA